MLADWFNEPPETAVNKVEEFEKEVKKKFIDEPGQMKLLIVVDKLLTGFDAPSATYLYIDKQMRDHGLFQAICRVNRLDGDDKEYGYIVDYKDLFKSLEGADPRLHLRRARRLRQGRRGRVCWETGLERPANGSKRPAKPSRRSASRSRRRRIRWPISATSAPKDSRQRRTAQGERAETARPLQARGSPRARLCQPGQ